MTEVITINNVEVHCPVNETGQFIPVKPICEALGIDNKSQQETLKAHPIWGATMVLSTTVGSDDKQREMLCIPLKYALGWIMGIDSRLVKPEAQASVLRYQEAAYEALYEHFFLRPAMQERKLKMMLERENAILQAEIQRKEIAQRIKEMKADLAELKVTDPTQLQLFDTSLASI